MADSFFYDTVRELAAAGIALPRLEARLLLAFVAGYPANMYDPAQALTPGQKEKVRQLLDRRLQHEPLDKILGRREFYKYSFIVNNQVLSPRPDSEILVETAATLIAEKNMRSVLELGVGSGCLLLSLLADFPVLSGAGVDVSPAALAVAVENACLLGVKNRVCLLLFDYFKDTFKEKFDLIISNPPYIPSGDIVELEPEVRNYDPRVALDGGADGLKHYRQIAAVAGYWLEENGYIVLEVGYGQAEAVEDIFAAAGWHPSGIKKDLSGVKRCVIIKK